MTEVRDSTTRHTELMKALKQHHTKLLDVIPTSKPIVYLDFQISDNIGDMLINQGAERFFEANGYQISARFSIYDLCKTNRPGKPLVYFKDTSLLDAQASAGATFVFQGGGSFGDIYKDFQLFRELIIERYPDTKIVILPQSIHFQSDAERQRAGRIAAAHPDLHLFVRDTPSLQFLHDFGLQGGLLPDMAHQLFQSDTVPWHPDGKGRLVLLRVDDERTREVEHLRRGDATFDWSELFGWSGPVLVRVFAKLHTIVGHRRTGLRNHSLWYGFRDKAVGWAVARIAPYEMLLTDRLHGMIFGSLIGKEIVFFDNSYGKLSRYYDDWLATSDRVVRNPGEVQTWSS